MHRFFSMIAIALLSGCEGVPTQPAPFGFVEPPEAVRGIEDADEDPALNLDDAVIQESQILFDQAQWRFHNPARTGVTGHTELGVELSDRTPFLGREYRRTILTDEVLVGLDCIDTGCVAASQSGGLFRTDSYGDWRAASTTLPELSRFYFGQDAWVACPLSRRKALLSEDSGQNWIQADFHCASNTARTVVNTSEITAVLDGERLRIGGFFDDLIHWTYAPVEHPESLLSGPGVLVVIGRTNLAVSTDGGHTFQTYPKDFSLRPVRDGVVSDKGHIIVVGDAPTGQPPIAISHNFGESWSRPTNWPGRDSRADFIVRARDGRFAVSNASGRGQVFVGNPLGTDWVELAARETSLGPVAPYRDGFVLSTTRGIAVSPSERGVYRLGLEQPIQDVVAVSQFEYVGVGVHGGVYRSHDRGLNWYPAGPSHSLPFTHVLHLEGHRLVAAGNGLVGQSDDGGTTWSLDSTENGCAVDWLVGESTTYFLGCADGSVFGRQLDEDSGRLLTLPWRTASTQGVWLPGSGSLVVLNTETEHLLKTIDHGHTWTEIELDSGESITALDAVGDTLSVRTASGRLAWKADSATPWQWLSSERALVGDAIAHRRFNDGRWLVLDQRSLWRIGVDLDLVALSDSARAAHFKILQSGDVFLIGGQSTTLLSRVSGD